MVERAGSQILNFDTGITRILTQSQESTQQLPGKARLAPTDAKTANVINRLFSADNVQAMLHQGLTPSISDRDVLQPNKFMAAIDQAINDIDGQIKDGIKNPKDQEKLQGLTDQLNAVREFRDELETYMNALIAG